MGNCDSRAQFEHGYIILQTHKPYYEPGEEVTGNIYISLDQPFPGSELEIELKGKEKVAWTVTKRRNNRNYTQHIRDKNKLINFIAPIYSLDTEAMMPGQYNFPFSIKLPHDLPSSIYYCMNSYRRDFALVEYKIKATLKCNKDDIKNMEFSQPLIIRQQPESDSTPTSDTSTGKVYRCCCCFSNGSVTIETSTEKSIYTPTEVVKLSGHIDNSDCKKDIKKVKVQLMRHVELKAKFKKRYMLDVLASPEEMFWNNMTDKNTSYSNSYVVLEKEYPMIEKGQSTHGDEELMELDLSEYGKEKGGEGESEGESQHDIKEKYHEDDFKALKEGVQPTSIGNMIKITYTLKVVPEYDGCCSCSSLGTSIGLFIAPPKMPSYQVLEAPEGWDPQVFENKNFDEVAEDPLKDEQEQSNSGSS